ncbi:hypothetical protein ONZ43_g6711 [Nemania bipapillata]|uniref:Uncharacterized protein n=1 Tax=Nemania bipapillata TaxID=110536 RepID=A0ACC2HXR4_9PEZI|nr:hypothetical protein ONZ43_g6711 [Nemania bipapillata]
MLRSSARATSATGQPPRLRRSRPRWSDVAGAVHDKAKAAFEQERDNQRKGGPLDQIGQDANTTSGDGKKKGWLW